MCLPSEPLISIVVPTYNEGPWVKRTVDAILSNSVGWLIEIIVVDDCSTDGSCNFITDEQEASVRVVMGNGSGVGTARNQGASHATGDVLIFLDAHVIPCLGWLDQLVDTLRDETVGIVGPAVQSFEKPESIGYTHRFINENLASGWSPKRSITAYEAPTIVGCGQAFRRSVFEVIGGVDPGAVRWGVEDMEISLRAWYLGYRCMACTESRVAHLFKTHEMRSFSISWEEYDVNLLRCLLTYFSDWRLETMLNEIKLRPNFDRSMERVATDREFWMRRQYLQKRFIRNDDWYISHFPIELNEFENRLNSLRINQINDLEMRQTTVNCQMCMMNNLGSQTKCLMCGQLLQKNHTDRDKRQEQQVGEANSG